MSELSGFEIVPYDVSLKDPWQTVIKTARNSLFLFDRNYMDYHSDRFVDCSMLAFRNGTAVAAFPASIDKSGHVATSHAGLTFGGLIFSRELRGEEAIQLTEGLLDALRTVGAKRLIVKMIPPTFWSYPSGDLDYALWRLGFQMSRRDLSTVLPLENAIPFNSLRRRSVKKAAKLQVIVRSGTVSEVHPLITDALRSRHGVDPVHTCSELDYLHRAFPENIFIRLADREGSILAGAVVYVYNQVWHTQYLASSAEGRDAGALDLVIDALISEARTNGIRSLSFGTCTEESGKVLNEGLLRQKESFGARPIVHDFLSADL